MTTGKTIALTRQTFVGKVMSLLLNTLSRFVIDDPEGWYGEGGGRGCRMGNTCTPVVESC